MRSCRSYLHSNYSPIFFIIIFYFNIILLSTLWSTFPLPLPHYQPNTGKDITLLQLHFPPTIQTPERNTNSHFSKGKESYFSLPHYHPLPGIQTAPKMRSIASSDLFSLTLYLMNLYTFQDTPLLWSGMCLLIVPFH